MYFTSLFTAAVEYTMNLFYKTSSKLDKLNMDNFIKELSGFKYKKNKKKPTISPKRFNNIYSNRKWYLTKEKYSTFLTGLYYLGYEKYSDRVKGMEPGTDQFVEFY
jgi:hypothetical protein